jgi:hypothetical protein
MVSTMPWMVRSRVERGALHLLDVCEQLAQAFEREELALQRHQHACAAAMALIVSRLSDGGQSIST